MGLMKSFGIKGRNPSGVRIGRHGAIEVDWFFDGDRVRRALDDATRQAMMHGCRNIRRRAQTSMGYVTEPGDPFKVQARSAPGQPPRAVRPHPFVRKFIYYHYDRDLQSAVIGPLGFRTGRDAPHNLEFGGRVRMRNKRRRIRKVGDGGEIRVAGGGRNALGQFMRQGIVYALIRTQAQADRANRINEEIYGPANQTITMAARPFMGPALEEEAPSLPALWANSVRG